MKTQTRNMGIDLLRIICMLAMIIQHLLGHGWIMSLLDPDTWKYELLLSLRSGCLMGISCFAMISGYVGVQGRYRYSALALQWLKVWVYSVAFTLLAAVLFPGTVDAKTWKTAFFPTLGSQYWYFTAYAGSFMLAPMVRMAIRRMNIRQGTVCMGMLLLTFGVLGSTYGADPFYTGSGKNTLWLVVLYAVGAYFGHFKPHVRMPMALLWLLAAGFAAMLAGLHSVAWRLGIASLGRLPANDSPRTVLAALAALLLFSRLDIRRGRRLVSVLGAASFGVYLIHDHPLVRMHTISKYTYHLAGLGTWTIVPGVVITSIGVYLLCAALDTGREKLFEALRVRQRLAALERRLVSDLWED